VRFHASRWRPSASELVVVGDVTEPDLKAKLEKALASWEGRALPATRPVVPAPDAPLETELIQKRGPAPQAYILMGMPGVARSSPDYVASQVAFQILGGGMSSRLFRNLREEKGYTYGVYARSEARKLGGASVIVGSVKAEVAGAATQVLLQELARLRDEPVGRDELDVARNALLLSLPGDFATTSGIASKLAEEVVFGLPDDYWEDYAAQLANVSGADVQRVARRYLDPGRLTTVMVCDPAAVRPQLRDLPLGPVETRPLPETPPAAVRVAQ
jgi:predicted Zn-dependent peptidase